MIRHVYLHVPFCHRICPYCSFYKHSLGGSNMAEFVEALLSEARFYSRKLLIRPATVYLGGGTPTALSESHLERLLAGLREAFCLDDLVEFCLEANPRTVTAEKAAMLRRQGITRVSLGVQAWDEATLKTLGRDHSPAEARETFAVLREAGIPSVNLDLMFSIPGQSASVWEHTLDQTLALRPDHISAYNLNYEEDTEFFERLRRGEFREDAAADAGLFFTALDRLGAAGYEHYETSNHALPGHRSAHNEAYWLGADYLGLGPSAVSTVAGWRWQNVCDTTAYTRRAAQDPAAVALAAEEITPEKRRVERFGLELRTARGLPVDLIQAGQQNTLRTLEDEGLLTVENGFARLTREGKPLVDSIAVALLG